MQKMPSAPPVVGEGIHLNLGCGAKTWAGFTNIDFPSNWSGKKPDIECDLRQIPLPDKHADSAYAIHVLEHFYRWEAEDVLREWVRLLKPGGQLIIEVPSLDKVLRHFVSAVQERRQLNPQATIWRLYGDPKYKDPVMVHKWCYSAEELRNILRDLGLHEVKSEGAQYHRPDCDMRVTGVR